MLFRSYTVGQIQGENPPYCGIDTIVPHLACVNALLDFVPIRNFPGDLVVNTGQQIYVKGLYLDLWRCFEEGKLPSQLGFPWAVHETPVDLTDYHAFTGKLFA